MSSATSTKITTRQVDCQKTMRTETVEVETTTISHRSSRSAREPMTAVTRHNIRRCSGWDDCGVRTVHGPGESYSWDLCPVLTTLNTR